MSLRRTITSIEVPEAKITRYLLDADHPKGASKAAFLTARGFSPERPEELSKALHDHLRDPGTELRQEPHPRGYGVVLIAEGPIRAPDGSAPLLRTIWNRGEDGATRFVTAYPWHGTAKPGR